MAAKTCVSLADQSPSMMILHAKQALKKSEFVELRLDFLKPIDIPKVLDNLKHGNYLAKCICTVRDSLEGGKFSGSEKERQSILKLISEYDPFLLDIEYNTLRRYKDFASYFSTKNKKRRILVSWHNFRSTPGSNKLKNKLKEMKSFSNNIKIVTMSKSAKDSARILSLYHNARHKRIDLVAFAMGEEGKITRILCTCLGSPFTYVSFGKPVAPGQYSLEEIKTLLGLEQKKGKTKKEHTRK